jgi:hypothetical protein
MAGKKGIKKSTNISPSRSRVVPKRKRANESSGVPQRYITIDWNFTRSTSSLLRAIRVRNFSPTALDPDMAASLELLDPHRVMRSEFAILSDYDLTRNYFTVHGLTPPSGFLSRQNYDRHRVRFITWLLQVDGGSTKDDPFLASVSLDKDRYKTGHDYKKDVLQGGYVPPNREEELKGGRECDEWLESNSLPPDYLSAITIISPKEAAEMNAGRVSTEAKSSGEDGGSRSSHSSQSSSGKRQVTDSGSSSGYSSSSSTSSRRRREEPPKSSSSSSASSSSSKSSYPVDLPLHKVTAPVTSSGRANSSSSSSSARMRSGKPESAPHASLSRAPASSTPTGASSTDAIVIGGPARVAPGTGSDCTSGDDAADSDIDCDDDSEPTSTSLGMAGGCSGVTAVSEVKPPKTGDNPSSFAGGPSSGPRIGNRHSHPSSPAPVAPLPRARPKVTPPGDTDSSGSSTTAGSCSRVVVARVVPMVGPPSAPSSTSVGATTSTPTGSRPESVAGTARRVSSGHSSPPSGPGQPYYGIRPPTVPVFDELPALPPPLPSMWSGPGVSGAVVPPPIPPEGVQEGSSSLSPSTPGCCPPGVYDEAKGVQSTPGRHGSSSPDTVCSVDVPPSGGAHSHPRYATVSVPGAHGSRVSLSSGVSRPLFSLDQVRELARCFRNCDRDLFRYLSSFMVTDLVDNQGYSLRELLAAHIFVAQYYEMSEGSSVSEDSM